MVAAVKRVLSLHRQTGLWLWFVLLASVVALPSQVSAITADDLQAKTYTDEAGRALPYRLLVPANYDATKKYPLVLFLHGAGERGNDNLKHLKVVSSPLEFVASAKEPVFFIAPQCPAETRWVDRPRNKGSYSIDEVPLSENLQLVLKILAQVQKEYSIDASRLYVTGLSMGGFGSWYLISRFPEKFAAAIPICGGGDPSRAASMQSIGIWAFHAADDKVVPVTSSRDMIRALWAAGHNPSYTEYTSGGHNSWDRAYRTPGLMDWMLAFHH